MSDEIKPNPIPIFPRGDGKHGWTLEYFWIQDIQTEANQAQPDEVSIGVSMEQAEQVLLAVEPWINRRLASTTNPPVQPSVSAETVRELVESAHEVVRISDRIHDAWDNLKADITRAEAELKGVKNE